MMVNAEWPAVKLVAMVEEEAVYADNNYMNKELVSTPAVDVKLLSFGAGQETEYEKATHDMSLFVVDGSGNLALGYEDVELAKSTVVVVPKGMLWGIKNTGNSSMAALLTVNKNN